MWFTSAALINASLTSCGLVKHTLESWVGKDTTPIVKQPYRKVKANELKWLTTEKVAGVWNEEGKRQKIVWKGEKQRKGS